VKAKVSRIREILSLGRTQRDWRRELGPFGRNTPRIALLTLTSFIATTLHSSIGWAEREPVRTSARRVDAADLRVQEVGSAMNARDALVEQRAEGAPRALDPDSAKRARESLSEPKQRAAGAARSLAPDAAPPGRDASPEANAGPFTALSLQSASAPIAAQAISLPSGAATVGGMGESFSAQLTTGVATFNVPFAFPEARGAVQPSLNLVYSSSGGFGDAGVGWALAGDVVISRQTDRGAPRYDDRGDFHLNQDRFIFGAQELVPICTVTSGTCAGALAEEVFPAWAEGYQYFRPRVEGSFLRFFWSRDHRTWRVQSKDGQHLELGAPLDDSDYTGALEANPARESEIYRWHLVRQYDSHGTPDATPRPQPKNVILYRYREDGAIRYLSDVYYTPPAVAPDLTNTGTFAHHLHIAWADRPDPTSSYRSGFLQEQRLRFARLDVSSRPFAQLPTTPRELVRRYHASYDAELHASLLRGLQQEGRCDEAVQETADGVLSDATCPRLPGLSFAYQRGSTNQDALKDSAGLSFEPFNREVQKLGDKSPPNSLDEALVALMDVDADSLPDLVSTAAGLYAGKHGLFLNGIAGELGFGPVQGMSVTGVPDVDAGVLSFGNANVSSLDPDGDGTVNLLHMPAVKKYSIFTPQKVGARFAWVGRQITTAKDQDPKIDFSHQATRVARADVNGDGLVDLVFTSATELDTFFALGRLPGGDTQFGHGAWATSTTATLSTEPIKTCLPWSAKPISFDDPEVRMADMNGDGLPDIVRLRAGQVLYWPGRGNGFWGTGARDDCDAGTFGQDRHVTISNAPQFGTTLAGGLELGDVNGDGLADVVEFRFDAVDIYLNENGTRFTDRQTLTGVPIKPNASRFVQITDLNGSGTPDLVWGQGYDYRYLDLTGGVQPYLLTSIDNGLGKLTELEYSSSTQLMLKARKAGTPWKRNLPMAMQVVVRSTVRDRLETVGRTAGRYVTEYTYRDPLFEGRQREFRGFESADSRVVGDDDGPSVTTRSTFLLGECVATNDDDDVCSYANRWQDNWREPLKGLPAIVETFDDAGIYFTTVHSQYELRQLYTGLDGRRVSVAFSTGRQSFSYDAAGFAPSAGAVSLVETQVDLVDVQQSESRDVPKRSNVGTARLESHTTFDDYGNPTAQIDEGCVDGCEQADESITRHTELALVSGDDSGWLFRPKKTFVTGSAHPEERAQARHEYNSSGDVTSSFATLSGTVPLHRFHAAGGDVAATPSEASAGADAPVEITTAAYTRDEFGNVTDRRAPLGRCRAVVLDPIYADLPVEETTYGGALDAATGCGQRAFTASATYDQGLSVILTSQDITGQPSKFEFDRFGRLTAAYLTDPGNPGHLAALPTVTYDYLLTEDAASQPYSIVVAHEQDGEELADASYHDTYSYVDGLGRSLVTLTEADPLEGDSGDFVVSGIRSYSAKGSAVRAYQPFFWTGEPLEFPLGLAAPNGFLAGQSDAIGRPTYRYGLDGRIKVYQRYHALAADTFDALDLEPGPHQGTYNTMLVDGHGRTIKTIERVHVGAGNQLEERLQLVQYLPTGEVTRLTQRRSGSDDVVRWLRYDSLGRLVLNVEPNTTKNFTSDEAADLASFETLRYAYNDLGELVGTSDARGCGRNYFYDTAGRIVGEDYSPCESSQAPYSAPDFETRTGLETSYHYDTADTSLGLVANDAGVELAANATFYVGRSVSVSDRGSRGVVRYDARGRITGGALQVAKPGVPSTNPGDRYAPRWYLTETTLDGAGRPIKSSTGVTTPELLGAGDKSQIITRYTERGVPVETDSSYGVLSRSTKVDADGRVLSMQLGDVAGTARAFTYDQQRRLKIAQTYRAEPGLWSNPGYPTATDATQQLVLEDTELSYDAANNVTAITDYRIPEEWPAGSKPVSREFEYDDLYHLTRSVSHYPDTPDSWRSPYDAENVGTSDGPKPSPHVDFDGRIQEQRYQYDHLGNLTTTTDNESGFFDRSLGEQEHGPATSGPHQIRSASNRQLAAASPRKGDMETKFDAAGNLTDLVIRRDGPCLPSGASCWQRFEYEFDELGRLSAARRFDLLGAERTEHDDLNESAPGRAPDVEIRDTYDAGGRRVIKTAVDPAGNASYTVYINGTYELRSTWWSDGDYVQTPTTVTVSVSGGGVRGRVLYSEEDLPGQVSGKQHLLLELSDYLGSNSSIIDHETSELVEFSTYQPYGGAESDYRPERWGQFRESYKFSGKEEDIEVGLAYFGARFLVIGLDRWLTPDPVTIHQVRGDANPYAYVGGRPMVATDPDGRELITLTAVLVAVAIGAIVGAAAAGTVYIVNNGWHPDSKKWWAGLGVSAGVGALAGAASAGVGLGVGSAIATPVWASIIGGGAGGATGGMVGYAAGLLGARLLGSHEKWNTGDFLAAGLLGGAIGALTGGVAYHVQKFLTPHFADGQQIPVHKVAPNGDAAAKWAAGETNDWMAINEREYGYFASGADNNGPVTVTHLTAGEPDAPVMEDGIEMHHFQVEATKGAPKLPDGSEDLSGIPSYGHGHPPLEANAQGEELYSQPDKNNLLARSGSNPNIKSYLWSGGDLYSLSVSTNGEYTLTHVASLYFLRPGIGVAGFLAWGGQAALSKHPEQRPAQ
jgi:RHS repeat-associated protein